MTSIVNDVTPRAHYTSTSLQTTFTVPFLFVQNEDLKVYVDGVLMTYDATPADNTEYSTTGEDDAAGGTIVFGGTGQALNAEVVIIRDIAIERTAQYSTTKVPISTLNTDMSAILQMMQELEADIEGRTLMLPVSDLPSAMDRLPDKATRAETYLYFDSDGNPQAGLALAAVSDDAAAAAASAVAAAASELAAAGSASAASSSASAASGSAAAALASEGAAASSAADAAADLATMQAISTMNNVGAWATSTGYTENEVVNNDGSSYVASADHTSGPTTEPGTGGSWATVWDLLAAKGDTGATGPAGADGIIGSDGADGATGPQGPAGADGADGADGLLADAPSDGSEYVRKDAAWAVATGGGGGADWSDPVDAVITPDADGTRDFATTGTRFATGYLDAIDITNNIVVGGTVDGRDIGTDGSKLDGIEASADVTDATNVATAGAIMSDGTGVGAETAATSTDMFLYIDATDGAIKKLDYDDLPGGVGGGGDAWSDVVDAVITPDADGTRDFGLTGTRFATGYFDNLNITTNITVGGTVDGRDLATDGSKLDGIEALADVTDVTNVTAAGALMDSELTSIADVKALNQSVVSGASPTFGTANFTDATNKRLLTDAQESKLDAIEALADVTDATNVAAAGAIMSDATNVGAETVAVSTDMFLFIDATDGAIKKIDFDNMPGGGDLWTDPIDGNITVGADSTYSIATDAARLAAIYTDDITTRYLTSEAGGGGDHTVDGDVSGLFGGATYGILDLGRSRLGTTSRNVAGLDLDKTFILENKSAGPTSNIAFALMEGTNAVRFAIPYSAVGNATYNPRSMLIAGPAPVDDTMVTVGYWQTNNSIFDNLACDTSTDGADLGVQNDLEVEGDIFTDSIKGSTNNTTIAIAPHGTGDVSLGNMVFDADQTIGVGQDNYVLTYDNAGGKISLEAAAGAGGGDAWGDAVDAVITPDADSTRDFATTSTRFATGYFDDLVVTTGYTAGNSEWWNDGSGVNMLHANGGNQEFRVYGAYTDENNGEWVEMKHSTIATMGTDSNGTGLNRTFYINYAGANRFRFGGNIEVYANFQPRNGSQINLGGSGTGNKWDTLYLEEDVAQYEQADHAQTPTAGRGQWWVRDDTPCTPIFTDDAGTDTDLTGSMYDGGEVTISAGALTVERSGLYYVNGEGDAADNLTDINGGSDGMQLILVQGANANNITVKNNAGSANTTIRVNGGDHSLNDNNNAVMLLVYAHSQWMEVSKH